MLVSTNFYWPGNIYKTDRSMFWTCEGQSTSTQEFVYVCPTIQTQWEAVLAPYKTCSEDISTNTCTYSEEDRSLHDSRVSRKAHEAMNQEYKVIQVANCSGNLLIPS